MFAIVEALGCDEVALGRSVWHPVAFLQQQLFMW